MAPSASGLEIAVKPAPTTTDTDPIKIPATVLPSPRVQRLERRVTLLVTVVPFIGVFLAIALLWGRGIGLVDVGILVVSYYLTGLGVTIGFHRMLTHGSFDASPRFRAVLAAFGSMALEGPVIRWVADHRRHHAFADVPGDPHSPHLSEAEGLKGVLAGLWHSHMGWMFDRETTKISRFAPDLLKEPAIRRVDKLFPLWALISLGVPPLAGLLITGTWWGALTAFVWGSLVRIFFLHHITWSINSICHFYGSRAFNSPDFSTNNWLLSLVSFGEAWHNNHHAFPTSARHGLNRFQFDLSAALIGLMEKLGLVWNVRIPGEKQMESKRI